MPDNSSSNKRIAKNTLFLYARMLLTMIVSLYTSRVILSALGFENYGLYNVVGSIVSMFTFLSAAMGNASGRFITYALGKGDERELHEVVSTACLIHWIIAGIVVVLGETVGLWFLHNKLVIPEGRMAACEWVYQFSIISCVVTIISIPYNSMVIAHEKLGTFAFISVFSVVIKLIIAFVISIVNYDRLVVYAFFILCTVLFERLLYQVYCWRHFAEARQIRMKHFPQFKEMISFAGWKLFGNMMVIANTQGVGILLNMFFGPVINAAGGIAAQVGGSVNGFVTNFQLAVRPQITKSYAVHDMKGVQSLIMMSSKLSFFLLLFFLLPIFIEVDKILSLWLVDVPEHTAAFVRLSLLVLAISPLENPIGIAKDSTGNIKKYSIVSSILQSTIIVFDYIALKLGAEPEVVYIIQFVVLAVTMLAKFFLVKQEIQLPFRKYLLYVLFRVGFVTVLASIIPVIAYMLLDDSLLSFLIVCAISVISVLISSFFVGLSFSERTTLRNEIKRFLKK